MAGSTATLELPSMMPLMESLIFSFRRTRGLCHHHHRYLHHGLRTWVTIHHHHPMEHPHEVLTRDLTYCDATLIDNKGERKTSAGKW